MELGKKILELRKKKGLSQEQLGDRIGVTRQTISNWELGETSPNTEQLKLLSKELNISIDELLDNDIKDILVEKVSNMEKLAGLILKIIKWSLIIGIGGFVLMIALRILVKRDTGRALEESIYCKIYGEEHSYNVTYEELTGRPIGSGGDPYFDDILDLYKYDDAHQIFNVINDYVKKNGGTCVKVADNLNDVVTMEINDLTKTSMKLIIHDTSPNRIVYGSDFYLEKFDNGEWTKVRETGKNYAFNDMAYYVDEHGILEMKQDWTYMYGELSKGRYRIVKGVFFDMDIPISDEDKINIWQEFEIEE